VGLLAVVKRLYLLPSQSCRVESGDKYDYDVSVTSHRAGENMLTAALSAWHASNGQGRGLGL